MLELGRDRIISLGDVIMSDVSEAIVPFAPAQKRASGNSDAVDQAGQTVMGMVQQAAAVASENCQHALGVAHKLSLQLLAAEDQIKRLEAEVRHYQDRAGRAEQWHSDSSAEPIVLFHAVALSFAGYL